MYLAGGVKALKSGNGQAYAINISITSETVDGGNNLNGRVIESHTPRDAAANADQTGTVNSFDVVSDFPMNDLQNGGTSNNQVDVLEGKENSGTTTHETSHAMGNEHKAEGGSLDVHGGTSVGKSNIRETLSGVGIGGNHTQRNANSSVGDGTLMNGSTNVGLGKGQVTSVKRYNRVMRRIERREERNAR